jgi:hypothetical protein
MRRAPRGGSNERPRLPHQLAEHSVSPAAIITIPIVAGWPVGAAGAGAQQSTLRLHRRADSRLLRVRLIYSAVPGGQLTVAPLAHYQSRLHLVPCENKNMATLIRRALIKGLIGGGAAAVLGVGAICPVFGRDKMAKQDVDYQDSPKGIQMCATCSLFDPPHRVRSLKAMLARMVGAKITR